MLASGLPETISDGEDLARFLVQGSHYSLVMVKPAAFLPNPKDHETSVARHGRAPVEMLRQLGVQAAGDRRLHPVPQVLPGPEDPRRRRGPQEPPPRHGGGQALWSTFSRSGNMIVSFSTDGVARLWTVPTGQPFGRPLEHGADIRDAIFADDDRYLVTASGDGTARIVVQALSSLAISRLGAIRMSSRRLSPRMTGQ